MPKCYHPRVEGKEEGPIPTGISRADRDGLNAAFAKLEEAQRERWARGPFELGQELRPKIPTLFGKWLDLKMTGAKRLTNLELALAYNDLRKLRPQRRDVRWASDAVKVHPPKKEMSEYRRGLRSPGPIVAYRIGRALEEQFNQRWLEEDRDRLRRVGIEGLPHTVDGAASGLDALIVAGCWADAIACIGTLVGRREELSWDARFEETFNDTMQRDVHDNTLPPDVYPALDEAWVQWITRAAVDELPPRFAAAYLLAKSSESLDQRTAADILNEWTPRRYK